MNEGSSKQKIIDNIKSVDAILVTVSTDPSVDELSAALALTMFINDLDKHATAVMSGSIPPAIHFLEPEKTFENSVDSLRDFVIALDKEKADHLRYKVDGDVVKIFITPYKTVITSDDLDYSQGDYNVEMAIAVGVKGKENLDKALEAHGRILHDAIVATIGLEPSDLGSLDYSDSKASSLSELAAGIIMALSSNERKMSEQVASALLTGIVSATDRFSNDRTTSQVMSISAKLMAAGANQQLIASKLREGSKTPMVDNQLSEKIQKDTAIDEKKGRRRRSKNRGLSIKHDNSESTNEAVENNNNLSSKPADSPETQTDAAAVLESVLAQSSAVEPRPQQQTEQAFDKPNEDLIETLNTPVSDVEQLENPQLESNPDSAPEDAEQLLDKALDESSGAIASSPPAADLAAELEAASDEAAYQSEAQASLNQSIEDSTVNTVGEAQSPDSNKPSFGGVLNATTEQAAEDKRRMEEADRNRTILSHNRPAQGFIENGLGSSPMNGAGVKEDDRMFNPLTEPVQTPEPQLPSVQPEALSETQPPYIANSGPTLADLDQQHRQPLPEANQPVFTPVPEQLESSTSALEAVQAAYDEAPLPTPAPIITPAMEAVRSAQPLEQSQVDMSMPSEPTADLSGSIPTPPPPPPPDFGVSSMPPLPPQGEGVPDFNQLPTPPAIPDMMAPSMPSIPTLPPENLESVFPAQPSPPQPPQQSSDPAAFKIPGQ